jgi:hypothetical protein
MFCVDWTTSCILKMSNVQLLVTYRTAIEYLRKHPQHKQRSKPVQLLHILQTSRSLLEIMDAVCIVEIAASLSEIYCKSFVLAVAPDILFSADSHAGSKLTARNARSWSSS